MPSLEVYRRRLPHWRLTGATYFVTWRVAVRGLGLTLTERSVVAEALHHFDGVRYALLAYVVMNDHVHVLVTPGDSYRLQDIVHSWKSYTAHTIRRLGSRVHAVWQHESFDRIVRDADELIEKARYILGNPWTRWPDLDDYAWLWVRE